MAKHLRPGVDTAIVSDHGASRDGQPISFSRAPAADLAPWIGRLYATKVDAPPDNRISCSICNDISFVWIHLAGDWSAESPEGSQSLSRAAVYVGPRTRRLPFTVVGSFTTVGMSLRPGASYAIAGFRIENYVNRIVKLDEFGVDSDSVVERYERLSTPEECLRLLEEGVRQQVISSDANQPSPITARFEDVSFTNPSITVSEFARQCDVDKRTVERIIRRDFGMSPKQVLRRSRALDMASHLRGVADQAEAEELALRYYDQSHLIHEFVELFGMSPTKFVVTPQPILTLALEARQARRLETIARIAPGAVRPWE